ncbi:hypothetical protein KC730_02420, partial [Candidatus Kaiserbacteria bacterium]|nr:hypothetical protein [Candidatus Kaiserbacteria bacterium]
MFNQPLIPTPLEDGVETRKPRKRALLKFFLFISIIFLTIVILVWLEVKNLNRPNDNFPSNQPITIEQGTDVRQITQILESFGVVRSKHLLYYTLVLFYDPTTIKASTYI